MLLSLLLDTGNFSHVFSNVWWIYMLKFILDFLKIFNEKHQTKIKDIKGTTL